MAWEPVFGFTRGAYLVRCWDIATNSNAALASILRPVLELLRKLHSRRQLLANASMAAFASARSRAVLMVAVGEGPQPGCVGRFGGCLHDAAHHHAIGEHVVVVVAPFAGPAWQRRA